MVLLILYKIKLCIKVFFIYRFTMMMMLKFLFNNLFLRSIKVIDIKSIRKEVSNPNSFMGYPSEHITTSIILSDVFSFIISFFIYDYTWTLFNLKEDVVILTKVIMQHFKMFIIKLIKLVWQKSFIYIIS